MIGLDLTPVDKKVLRGRDSCYNAEAVRPVLVYLTYSNGRADGVVAGLGSFQHSCHLSSDP